MAHAVLARFNGLADGACIRVLFGRGFRLRVIHLHPSHPFVGSWMMRDPGVTAGVRLPHVRAEGGGQYAATHAPDEREQKHTGIEMSPAHRNENL